MSLHTIRISVSKDSSPNHHISIITLSHLWDPWSQLQIHVFRKYKLVRASHNTPQAKYYQMGKTFVVQIVNFVIRCSSVGIAYWQGARNNRVVVRIPRVARDFFPKRLWGTLNRAFDGYREKKRAGSCSWPFTLPQCREAYYERNYKAPSPYNLLSRRVRRQVFL